MLRPALLGLMLLAACSPPPFGEIRGWAPSNSGTFAGNYRTLALCTLDALDERSVLLDFRQSPPTFNRYVDRVDTKIADVTGYRGAANGTIYGVFEVRFRQIGEVVDVQLRQWEHAFDKETIWPAVERCGAKG